MQQLMLTARWKGSWTVAVTVFSQTRARMHTISSSIHNTRKFKPFAEFDTSEPHSAASAVVTRRQQAHGHRVSPAEQAFVAAAFSGVRGASGFRRWVIECLHMQNRCELLLRLVCSVQMYTCASGW